MRKISFFIKFPFKTILERNAYLAGNFDIAREYFTPDGKHLFNNLEFDVDGIIEGYNSHSLIFKDIKHNDREVYTGYFTDGSVETFHDFNWSATPSSGRGLLQPRPGDGHPRRFVGARDRGERIGLVLIWSCPRARR